MQKMKTVFLAVLFGAASSSCAGLGLGKKKSKDHIDPIVQTETKTVYEKEYLPGRTVLQPYEPIPEDYKAKAPELSGEYLEDDGNDDIEGIEAVGVGINWSEQYHDLSLRYNGFLNWAIGLRAGQEKAQQALDDANPDAPGVPEKDAPSE